MQNESELKILEPKNTEMGFGLFDWMVTVVFEGDKIEVVISMIWFKKPCGRMWHNEILCSMWCCLAVEEGYGGACDSRTWPKTCDSFLSLI